MRVEPIEAVVHAGEQVMQYVRLGSGAPLVLITRRDGRALQDDPLVLALAARFRVIIPHVPVPEVEGWLHHMIEGLGLQQPRVVIDTGSSPE